MMEQFSRTLVRLAFVSIAIVGGLIVIVQATAEKPSVPDFDSTRSPSYSSDHSSYSPSSSYSGAGSSSYSGAGSSSYSGGGSYSTTPSYSGGYSSSRPSSGSVRTCSGYLEDRGPFYEGLDAEYDRSMDWDGDGVSCE